MSPDKSLQPLFLLRPEARGWLLTGGGENLRETTMDYCHCHLPAVVHKMDPGILAQQSDVRCKRGRRGVIMIAPVAFPQYSQPLGARGRRTGILRPLFLALRGARLPCKDEESRFKEAGPPGRRFLRKPL